MSTPSVNHSTLLSATRAAIVPDICAPEDVALYLRISRPTALRWMREGTIQAAKLGSRWYVTRDALLSHLRQRSIRAVP